MQRDIKGMSCRVSLGTTALCIDGCNKLQPVAHLPLNPLCQCSPYYYDQDL
jgi:hypothetical protein